MRFFLVFLTAFAFASELLTPQILDRSPIKIFTNLDSDKEPEAIVLQLYKKDKYNDYYHLLVVDDNNTILWKSPKVKEIDDNFAIGEFDCGEAMPEVVVDNNANASMDIIIALPQCDLSPKYFKSFELLKNNHSVKVHFLQNLIETQKDSFVWKDAINLNADNLTWISRFKKSVSKDLAIVEIYKINNQEYYRALALVKFSSNGVKVVQYIIPMHNIQTEGYIAKIGEKDHFNSKGKRLKNIRDILIQDRANLFKGKGDSGDEETKLFRTHKERQKIKSAWIIPLNTSFEDLQDKILHHNPRLEVVYLHNKLYIYLLGYHE